MRLLFLSFLLLLFFVNGQPTDLQAQSTKTLISSEQFGGPIKQIYRGVSDGKKDQSKQDFCSSGNGLEQSCTDSQGNLYVTDMNNRGIHKITSNGKMEFIPMSTRPLGITVTSDNTLIIASHKALYRYTSTDKHPKKWELNDPEGAIRFHSYQYLAIDAHDNVYVNDYRGQINKVTPDGTVSIVAGDRTRSNKSHENGIGKAARFSRLVGIAIDKAGNLYVAERKSYVIRKVTPDGVVSNFAGTGVAGFKDGPKGEAQFNSPKGMVFDNEGNLYIADRLNFAIRKIDTNGNVTTVAGIGGISGNQNGKALASTFGRPVDVSIANNQLYIVDWVNNEIKTIGLSSTYSDLNAKTTIEVQQFTTYPNPTSDWFTLNFDAPSPLATGRMLISNMDGKIILVEDNVPTNAATRRIDLTNYPSGTYFVHMQIGEQVFTQQVVKASK